MAVRYLIRIGDIIIIKTGRIDNCDVAVGGGVEKADDLEVGSLRLDIVAHFGVAFPVRSRMNYNQVKSVSIFGHTISPMIFLSLCYPLRYYILSDTAMEAEDEDNSRYHDVVWLSIESLPFLSICPFLLLSFDLYLQLLARIPLGFENSHLAPPTHKFVHVKTRNVHARPMMPLGAAGTSNSRHRLIICIKASTIRQ